MLEDSEALSLFLYESEQLIDQMDSLLLEVEAGSNLSAETINELFRLAHTLKGSAAMMGYKKLSETTHRAENILQQLRQKINSGQNIPSNLEKEILALALDFTAYFRKALEQVALEKQPEDSQVLDEKLVQQATLLQGEAKETKPVVNLEVRPSNLEAYARYQIFLQSCPLSALRAFLIYRAVSGVTSQSYTVPNDLKSHPELSEQVQAQGFELGFIPQADIKTEKIQALLEKQVFFDHLELIAKPETISEAKVPPKKNFEARLNISQSKVNALIDLMNELLAAETALEQRLLARGLLDRQTEKLLRSVARYGVNLQSGLNELGMTELNGLFLRIQRMARDLLNEAGKQAEIVLEGGDLTLDKSVLESIHEMLIHVIRNAVDHGLELPMERLAAGKLTRGKIKIAAERQNGRLRITVSDDGQGINSQKVLATAQEKGLLTKPAEAYSSAEINALLLVSGFTTKKKVSQNSGRGVGLDAVQHMVRKIGGHLQITSTLGQGSQFLFDLPLSLTAVKVLRLSWDGKVCYVSTNLVKRIVRLGQTAGQGNAAVAIGETGYQALLPGLKGEFLVLFRLEQGKYYLSCQEVGEPEELLVKPLPSVLKQLLGERNWYSGCVQDHLGGMHLILDLAKLALKRF